MTNGLFVLIPIMFLGIGVAAIISSSILKMQRLRLEEARLRAGDSADMRDLVRQVSALQQEVTELQERVEFTERLLAQAGERAGLPAVAPPRQLP